MEAALWWRLQPDVMGLFPAISKQFLVIFRPVERVWPCVAVCGRRQAVGAFGKLFTSRRWCLQVVGGVYKS